MAIWQYTFFVLPQASLNDNSSVGQLRKDDENSFDDSIFWQNEKLKCDFFSRINSVLPYGQSWNKDLIIYGNIESNCFEVLCENGFITSTSFRIDFSVTYEAVLNFIIEFFILNGLVIISEDLRVVPLNFELIKAVIEESSQFKKYKNLLE